MMLSFLTLFFSVAYALFLLWCYYHWNKLRSTPFVSSGKNTVAVIVPLRNEEKNVEALLNSLAKQRYSPFEIILIDDHSTDSTNELAQKWIALHPHIKAKCIPGKGQSKKDALSMAIERTNAELIMTTDADCTMGENWIGAVAGHYQQTGAYLISSPVIMNGGDSFIDRIQSSEYAGLTSMGAAAIEGKMPMFCSGANLAFPGKVFIETGGYSGSLSSSGDDTQLMRKIAARWPGKISFLKDMNASVVTNTTNSANLFEQRRRWASKIPFTLSTFTVSIAFIAWVTHLLLLSELIHSILNKYYFYLIIALSIKILSELLLLNSAMKFMNQKCPDALIILVQPFYAIYIVAIGIIAPFTTFTWKGRKTR